MDDTNRALMKQVSSGESEFITTDEIWASFFLKITKLGDMPSLISRQRREI